MRTFLRRFVATTALLFAVMGSAGGGAQADALCVEATLNRPVWLTTGVQCVWLP